MISLETAKQLKEAGWSKETENCYYDEVNGDLETAQKGNYEFAKTFKNHRPIYPCPSLEELLAEIPEVQLNKRGEEFDIYFFGKSPLEVYNKIDADPAEAVAQLWLKLKQEKLC